LSILLTIRSVRTVRLVLQLLTIFASTIALTYPSVAPAPKQGAVREKAAEVHGITKFYREAQEIAHSVGDISPPAEILRFGTSKSSICQFGVLGFGTLKSKIK
jgi:hypothetical protein